MTSVRFGIPANKPFADEFPKNGAELVPPVLEFLRHLAGRETDIRTSSVPIFTLSSLFDNSRRLASYLICVSNRNMIASANFDWIGEPLVGPAVCYYLVTAPLGGFDVCTLVRRAAEIGTTIDGRSSVTMGEIAYVRPHVFENGANYLATVAKEIDRLSELTKDMPVLVLGDVFDSIPDERRTIPTPLSAA